jgi:3-hydroxyacyl-[acyl-carrier-protein] dehydratase
MSGGTTLDAVGIREILAALPHRYPFLLVDRIVDIRGDEHGVGIKNVTVNEPHFVGHFPNNPVMPGVLILEGMAQTAGTLCIRAQSEQKKPSLVYFLTIDNVKFRKPVVPGDRLEYHMTRIRQRRNMWWFRGEAKVDGELVAEAELGAMVSWD